MTTSNAISEMIINQEKAKLSILRELTGKDLSWFELTDIISAKYYNKSFVVHPFVEILKQMGLIEEREGKYVVVDKPTVSKAFSTNRGEIEKILSMDFGKGDLVGQLSEQEKYIIRKVLSLGNSITPSRLHDSISDDIDRKIGPFSDYSSSSYGRKRSKEIARNLADKGFLKADDVVSIPQRILSDFIVSDDLTALFSDFKSRHEKIEQLIRENKKLSSEIELLKTEVKKFDLRSSLSTLQIPQSSRNYINKAMTRINEGSFSEAIMNCYRVSETLVKDMFNLIYTDSKDRRIKHEDKLRRIWNDEPKEKHQFPGIKVIASLLSVILWYRNKMAAHTEMKPTRWAARISLVSLIQALIEYERLGFTSTKG